MTRDDLFRHGWAIVSGYSFGYPDREFWRDPQTGDLVHLAEAYRRLRQRTGLPYGILPDEVAPY